LLGLYHVVFSDLNDAFSVVKGETERGLCNGKPRQDEVLRPMGSTSWGCTACISAVLMLPSQQHFRDGNAWCITIAALCDARKKAPRPHRRGASSCCIIQSVMQLLLRYCVP